MLIELSSKEVKLILVEALSGRPRFVNRFVCTNKHLDKAFDVFENFYLFTKILLGHIVHQQSLGRWFELDLAFWLLLTAI